MKNNHFRTIKSIKKVTSDRQMKMDVAVIHKKMSVAVIFHVSRKITENRLVSKNFKWNCPLLAKMGWKWK